MLHLMECVSWINDFKYQVDSHRPLNKEKQAEGNEGFYHKNLNFTIVSLNPPYSFLILTLGVISPVSMLMTVAGEVWDATH